MDNYGLYESMAYKLARERKELQGMTHPDDILMGFDRAVNIIAVDAKQDNRNFDKQRFVAIVRGER